MRSGRMRSEFRTRSRMVTSPLPSMLGGRLSSRTTWSCWSWSSTASSMVTIRSSCRDERGQHVEQGRLAGAGAAGDDDVEPGLDAGVQQFGHLRRQRAEARSGSRTVNGVLAELADGQRRAAERRAAG